MYVTSKVGTELLRSEYQIIDTINGIPTLETDYSQLKHKHTEPMLMLSPAFDDNFVMVIKEQESVSESSRLRLTGVHSFIYDFSLDRIYETYTQYFSLENILTLLFDGTEYTYEVSGETRYNALEFENFGDNDKMSLINQICERWTLEYRIQGNKVFFSDKRGRNTTKQFRYKMNIYDSHVNLDITEGATYIRGYFGKKDEENPENNTYVEKEMTHPLADDFGIRHAKPYSNEVITQEDTMKRYLKMKIEETWKLSVEIDVLDLLGDGKAEVGDEVWAIDERLDLKYKTRIIEKRDFYDVDDNVKRTKIVLGNKTFIESVSAQEVTADDVDGKITKYYNEMIEQLKAQFDNDFRAARDEIRGLMDAAKEAIMIEVAADRERMEVEFNNTLDVWTNDFNQDVENAMKYAEEQAKTHSDAVEGKLDDVTSTHKSLLDELKSNVMDIDDFLGDSRALTLDERFNEATQLMEDRIRNINVNSYNMLQGTRFDESAKVDVQRIAGAQILTTQHINRIRLTNDGKGFTTFEFTEPIKIEANTNYYLTTDYLTNTTPELDYLAVETPTGWMILNNADTGIEGFMNLKADGKWNKTTIRINSPTVIEGKLRMGTRWNRGEAGTWIDVRQPYLTNTSNREWLPHPNDATQSIEMVTRRMTELEDGLDDYITRSEFDFDTGNLEQYIKHVEENVEGNKQILQKVENWQSTNGASIEETVYGFNQKVWLNDFSEINANLVPQSSSAWEQGSFWSSGGEATDSTTRMNIRTKEVIPLQLGERYTISDYSTYPSNVEKIGIHQWDANGKYVGLSWIARGASTRFTAIGTQLRLALHARDGFTVLPEFVDEPDKRIQIKLEHGSETTPMLNALSRIEQLADSVSIKVQELDGEYLTESDIQVKAGYVQLGSKQLGDNELASIFRVSPKSIDAIADNLNLTGNLNVKGQIEAMALNAINVNAGTVRSYILESNVITGDHLAVGTAMIDKLFATSGRIDQLITKEHFVRNVKALSIDAVEGNFSSLMTKYLSANYIDVDYINGKNAWFESMYTSNAMISKLTSQTAFIRDIRAIEITANQLNLDTLRNRFNQIEGGLHITRAKDGVRWIENGVPRGNVPVQTYDSYAGSNIRFNGLNFITDNSHWQTFKYFYTPHEGRILRVVWAVGLLGSSGSASEYVEVQVDGFGNNNQINNGSGSSSRRVFVSRGDTTYITQDIPLPPPNYNLMQANLQVRRSPSGTGVQNDVYARILHIGQYG